MRRRLPKKFSSKRRRGFWLRYFLDIAMAVAAVSVSGSAAVQVDCVQNHSLVIRKISGRVVDPFGVAIPNAIVALSGQGGGHTETRTGPNGRFVLAATAGQYRFETALPGFETAWVEVTLRRDLWNSVHSASLDVVLGLASLYCPWVTTSKRDFKYNIRANIKRSKESEQRNATQK